jgi:murein DD-endopeptidase MepM/ murein hydrolase activator NlpD
MLTLTLPDFSDLPPLFVWPVDGQLSSKFGRRRSGWHQGIDITADRGAPVTASASGVVVGSAFEPRYGRVVRIEHLNGFTTIYAHNDENLVESGERVTLGQPIAAVGQTGRATAAHVHFEIRQAGLAYNPLYMLPFPPLSALIDETSAANHDDDE